jgi:hypothetical protein
VKKSPKDSGPNRREIYEDEKVFNHESYGMVGFSRISGQSGPMFGSSLPDQGSFIRLRVTRARRTHSLGRDWYHGSAKTMLELDLSASQFAELITSMNMGAGVPCTLRFCEGRPMDPCPEEKLEAEQVREDFKEKTAQVARNMTESKSRIDEILAKKTLTKADREEVEKLLGLVIQDVRSNMPFWLDQFHEATGKIVSAAKAEVDAFMTHALMQAGQKALAEGASKNLLTERLPPLVFCPWSADQVESLNAFQVSDVMHPFTGKRGPNGEETVLIATPGGWVEKENGPIVQTWAHEFMTDWSWKKRVR